MDKTTCDLQLLHCVDNQNKTIYVQELMFFSRFLAARPHIPFLVPIMRITKDVIYIFTKTDPIHIT